MAQRPFRIFALPLARLPKPHIPPKPSQTRPLPTEPTTETESSTSTSTKSESPIPLILYQVSQPDSPPPSASSSRYTLSALANRGLNGAQVQWLKLSKKKPDSWLFWFYTKGEGLMDKIEYEEWMLKGIHEGRGVGILTEEDKKAGKVQEKIQINLLRPEMKEMSLPPLLPHLHKMLQTRIPYHKKMMWRSVIFSPLTWPFAIIPVLPNFPLFYVLWRAWSHYKAWRGATYLNDLVNLEMITESPSKELTQIYDSTSTSTSSSKTSTGTGGKGVENHSPDETTTTPSSKPITAESTGDGGPGLEGRKVEIEGMNPQEKGEKVGSGDGTHTPKSMVYDPKSASSSNTTNEKSDSTGRHPSLLLTTDQIPVLRKTFDLRPAEVLDVTRAVEQADLRAKAADRKNGGKSV